jgi:chromosome segregation protein
MDQKMRLKKLEISGFKTFRDKVVLEFSHGISAVVGPNGCGKSNIVDALRWAMGEQRVKILRAKRMDDIVFNGAEGAPPVGMAEVTITLVSDDKPFPGAYAQCGEVAITRRLFREEDSEYYINKVSCRLLDVKEFFMDTGVGARTYSLVEQNSVSTLVEAKPEERRQYIEEVAGIAKYKSRKEAALRKMEATKQNMLRLNDIIKEVKKQLSVVTRQAKRAEQYKLLKKEISEADISLALRSYSELIEKQVSLKKEKESLQVKEIKIGTEMKAKEAAFEDIKLDVLENERLVADCQEQLYGLKNAINMKEQWIEFSRGKIADILSQKQRDQAEVKMLEKKLDEIAREMKVLSGTVTEMEREIDELREALCANRTKLEGLTDADKLYSDGLEAKKVAYIDVVAEKSRLRNMEINLARVYEDIGRRKEKCFKEVEENKKRCDSLCQTLQDIGLGLKEDEEEKEELKRRHDVMSGSVRESKDSLKNIEENILKLKEEYGRKSARLSSLQQFHEGYAWCSEGIKSIMTAKKEGRLNELACGDLLGLVADHIDVPMNYEAAVEAVLGEKLQYVIVKSQEEGVKAIDYLKNSAKGRGTFVPLAIRNHDTGLCMADHLQDAVRLIDHVKIHDDYKEVLTYLLGDVLLISTLNEGLFMWRQNGFRGTFVTPEGDIINPQGILTGGSNAKGERRLLADKREIDELKKFLADLNRELIKAMGKRDKTDILISQSEEELRQIKTEIHRLEIQINGKLKDLERFEDELNRTNQRLSILVFDQEVLNTEEKEAAEKQESIRNEHIIQQEREKIIDDEMSELKEKLENLREELGKCEKAFTASNVLLAAREEKKDADNRTLIRLEASRSALNREISDKKRDAETSAVQVEELLSRIAVEQKSLETLYQEYQILEQELIEKRVKQQKKAGLLREGEREIGEIKNRLEHVLKEANEREMSLREIAFQMDALKNGMNSKHNIDMDVMIKEYAQIEEDRIKELIVKLEKSRTELENFGEVNLLALKEYDELMERYDFLTAQYADISASLHSLQRTIERINSISIKRFAETFEAVNICFKEMFARIFPGGRGKLNLIDSADMLETGVDIDIRIPGKRAQNISLLSGGEKSLAAIALIFAILNYRPVPFLMLDEVDAALDDANIALFNKLIRDVAGSSQVIIITHNKKTMEVAENLFGITMQNQGISTLVSVSLN